MAPSGLRLGVLGLALVIGLSIAAPVVAHGNYLAADAQVTADGVVRMEGVFMITKGWVVLHANTPGGSEDVVGHVSPEQNAFRTDVAVTVNRSYWADVTGNRSLWAVLHFDADNDDAFDASSDPPIGGRDDPDHAVRIPVRNSDRAAFVLAEQEHAQETNRSAVTIRRVALPEDGHLVIQTNENGSPGDIIGNRSLEAGQHETVTVALAEHFYHHQPEQFSLWAVIYRADGDGQVDEGAQPVMVNGSLVATRFPVKRTDELEAGHSHTPSVTRTPRTATPSPTPTEHDHEAHEHTVESTPTPTASPTSTPSPTRSPGSATRTPGQPGMGFSVAIVATLIGLIYRQYRLE